MRRDGSELLKSGRLHLNGYDCQAKHQHANHNWQYDGELGRY
jgi:hypothetical protein